MPLRASLPHAQRHLLHGFGPRPSAIVRDRRRPQEPAEACLAGADRSSERRRLGTLGDHGRDRQVQDLRLALAGAVHAGRASTGFCTTGRARPARRRSRAARVGEVVRRTLAPPPHEATHWTARAMAKAAGLAVSTVQASGRRMASRRIAGGSSSSPPIRPSPRSCTTSSGSMSIRRPMPWCCRVDEKSQIQALDRTQPGLPMKKGRDGHDDPRLQAERHDDAVRRAQRARRHRHRPKHAPPPASGVHPLPQRASSARSRPDKAVPRDPRQLRRAQDPKVRRWLARHPRWTFHFTPTSCSWLNAVEGFFAKLFTRRLKRGVFCSLVDLQAAINRFVAEHNQNPKPFIWRADPDAIIAARNRGFQALESIH